MPAEFDYLVLGHIARDITPTGFAVGGTVAYAGLTAVALGHRAAAVTSSGPDLDTSLALPGMCVYDVPADKSTVFENVYTPQGRVQRIHSVAGRIGRASVPASWRDTPIVHLGPLAHELDPDLARFFSDSLVVMTVQGWLRSWDNAGNVFPDTWEEAQAILPLADVVILSEEDLLQPAMLAHYRAWSSMLVLTRGERGCTVFWQDEMRDFPAPAVEVDSLTGAGDVFAAAFSLRLWQARRETPETAPWAAARYAVQVASCSVTQPDLDAKTRLIATMAATFAC
ncbi:MAG: hypothetical protein KC418_00930 [Anaerolineales bacterium]|nr:hypothetical protein [Anaerolineales bacterium]MCB8954780.1 ribokinase [Ardenticatenales bacterium]